MPPSRGDLDAAARRLGARVVGPPVASLAGLGAPVEVEGQPAWLKVTREPEELAGARALAAWDGDGAVRLLARDGDALLLERAGATLRARVADDAEVTRVLCAVAARLHARPVLDLGGFPTLRRWCRALLTDRTPAFERPREFAERLLARSDPPVLLHGDLHPDNVLDGGPRGWLAVDPKGLAGPRGFDHAVLFLNSTPPQAVDRLDARLRTVAAATGLPPTELVQWVAIGAALSGLWHREDGRDDLAEAPWTIMRMALDRAVE